MKRLLALLAVSAVFVAYCESGYGYLPRGSVGGGGGGGTSPTSYYVDSIAGSDSNPGTSVAPWQTIAKVNAGSYNPGDSINFQGGQTFTITTAAACGSGAQATSAALCFNTSNMGGTAANPVTITSYGTGQATIQAPGNAAALMAYDVGGFTLENLTFVGNGTTAPMIAGAEGGVMVENDLAGNVKLDGVTITNITVHGFSEDGLTLQGFNGSSGYQNAIVSYVTSYGNTGATDGNGIAGIHIAATVNTGNGGTDAAFRNLLIDHCYAHDNPGYHSASVTAGTGSGINVSNFSGSTVQDSLVVNNGGNAVNSEGLWAADATNVTIQSNEIYGQQTKDAGSGDGLLLDGGVSNSFVQYNYTHGNAGSGFIIQSFSGGANTNNTLRYNISQGDVTNSTNLYGNIQIAAYGTTTGLQVYGNDAYATSTTSSGAIVVTGGHASTAGAAISNNIFYSLSGIQLVSSIFSDATPASVSFTGNDYFTPGKFSIKWGANAVTSIASLAAWQTAGQENAGGPVGTTADPTFTTPGGGLTTNTTPGDPSTQALAYVLQSGSTMVDTGQPITSPGGQDFFGNTLPSSFLNIGADDTGGGTPPSSGPPPTPGALANTALPEIAGLDTVGSVLTVKPGTYTGATGSKTYKWHAIGSTSSLSTGTSLTLTSGMLGQRIQVNETANDGNGNTDTELSDYVGPVVNSGSLPAYPFPGATDGAGHTLFQTALPTYPGHFLENGHAIYPGCSVPPVSPPTTTANVWYIDPVNGRTQTGGATGHAGSAFKDLGAIFGTVSGYPSGGLFPGTIKPGDVVYVEPGAGGASLGVLDASGNYSTSDGTTNGTVNWLWIMGDPAASKPPLLQQISLTGGGAGFVFKGFNIENTALLSGQTFANFGINMINVSGTPSGLVHDLVFEGINATSWVGHSGDAWSVGYPSSGGHSDGSIQTASPYMEGTQDPSQTTISATTSNPTKLFINQNSIPSLNGGFIYVWPNGYFHMQNLPIGSGVPPTNTGIPPGTIYKDVQGIPGLNVQAATVNPGPPTGAVVNNNAYLDISTGATKWHLWVGQSGSWVDKGAAFITIAPCDAVANASTGCPTVSSSHSGNGTNTVGCDVKVGSSGGCGGGTPPIWNGVTRNMTSEPVMMSPGMRITPAGWWNTYDIALAVNGAGINGNWGPNTDPNSPGQNDTLGTTCVSLKDNTFKETIVGISVSRAANVILYHNKIRYRAWDAVDIFSDHRVILANNLIADNYYGLGHADMIQFGVNGLATTAHFYGNVAINNEGYSHTDPANQFPNFSQGIGATDEDYDDSYVADNILFDTAVNSLYMEGAYNVQVHNDVFHDDTAGGQVRVGQQHKIADVGNSTTLPAFSMLENNITNSLNRVLLINSAQGLNSGTNCSQDQNTVGGNVALPTVDTNGSPSIINSVFCGTPLFTGVSNGAYAGVFPDINNWSPDDWRSEVSGVTSPFMEYHPVAPANFPFPNPNFNSCPKNEFSVWSCTGTTGIVNLRPNPNFVGTPTTGFTTEKTLGNLPTSGTVGTTYLVQTPTNFCGQGTNYCGGIGGQFVNQTFLAGLYTRANSSATMAGYGASTTFTITGSGFGSSGTVTIDGNTATTSSWTATKITGTVPAASHAPAFTITGSGYGATKGSITVGGQPVTVNTWNATTIAGIMPPNAPVPSAGNTVISLNGGGTGTFGTVSLNTSVSAGTISSASITGLNDGREEFQPPIVGAGVTTLGAQAPPADHGRKPWANPPSAGAYEGGTTTTATATHYWYSATAPECNPSCTAYPSGAGYINVYDIDNSFTKVQTITLPTTVKGVRGLFADSTGTHLYVPNYATTNLGDTTTGRLLSWNLSTGSADYDQNYSLAAIDRACLSSDDSTIYAPAGENVSSGTYASSWYVITASTGAQTGVINLTDGAVRPHNTVCSANTIFMAAVDNHGGATSHHSVTMYNTSSHAQTTAGPFTAGDGRVRPFAVDIPHGLIYVNLEDWVGFAVANTSGTVLYDSQKPPSYTEPGTSNTVNSHGIAVTPNGNDLYVADPNMGSGSSTACGVEHWDVSGVRTGSAPVYKGFIRMDDSGSGSCEPNVNGGKTPGWLSVTNDGKWVITETGQVFSTTGAAPSISFHLSDPNQGDGQGTTMRTRYSTEIDHN